MADRLHLLPTAASCPPTAPAASHRPGPGPLRMGSTVVSAWTTLAAYPCGCLEQSRPCTIPDGFVVLEGEMEWTEFQVDPCGDRATCQHPLSLADRGGEA